MSNNMQHGVICRRPDDPFGYFAWPSIARMDDGTLIAGASGLRHKHVCPWGKTTLFFSHDDGKTWTEPVVVHDSPLDDRDVGVISLGGNDVLITWFTLDPRNYRDSFEKEFDDDMRSRMRARLSTLDDEVCAHYVGSWTRISHDGGETWSEPRRAPVSAPHGPILLKDGRLMYVGKQYYGAGSGWRSISAAVSSDQGATWEEIGTVPPPPGYTQDEVYEPHVCEMPDGRLIVHLRVEKPELFTWQSESADGGRTWSEPVYINANGAPAHILLHSSGVLVSAYSYRHGPYGQRVTFSKDGGKTWINDMFLRDDGPSWDLGYPASIEMPDGSILTVYYQPEVARGNTGILYTRWNIPEEILK